MQSTSGTPQVSERHIGVLVLVASAVCVVSGVVLAFAYRPGAHGWLRTVHAGSAAVALISAIAARVVGSGGRLRVSARALLSILLGVLVIGAAFATGTVIAWQGGTAGDAGMFLGPGSRVRSGDATFGARALIWTFVVHAALAAGALLLLTGRSARLWWSQRREGAAP